MRLSRADKIKAQEIADKHGLTLEEVKSIITAPYSFIAETTRELVFEDGLTKEEFAEKKTNFNIPSIGKLYASNYLYNEIQKKKNKKH
tara:strand:- start:9177 stop:9440 length:264 start_codon:yes stop_codon:yes gene_type:complete